MVISPANPGRLAPFIDALASQLTWKNTVLPATHALEALFYSSLWGGILDFGRLLKWLRETSIDYVSEIQTLFNLANVGFLCLSAKELLDKIQERCDFSIAKDGYATWTLKSAAVTTAVAGAAFLVENGCRRLATPLAKPETITITETVLVSAWDSDRQQFVETNIQQGKNTEVVEKFSMNQRIAKVLHVTQLVLDVATAYFVKNRFWFAVTFVTSSYSLWKNINFKWITFTRKVPVQINNPRIQVSHLQLTYGILALPLTEPSAQEDCSICMESDNKLTKTIFCASHVFHKKCIAKFVHNESKKIIQQSTLEKRLSRESCSYSIIIDPINLPFCPSCRERPRQHTLLVGVTDKVNIEFDASVIVTRPPVDRQYLFENLYAIYNTAQAGLVFLQTYPQLTGVIYKIQKVMLPIDLMGTVLTLFYLSKKMEERLGPGDRFKIIKLAAIGLSIGFMGGLSCCIVLQILSSLKSAMILKEGLNQLGLSADVLKTLDVSFGGPLMYKMMQALWINRIVISTALAFFSSQRKTSLLTIVTQLASLIGVSNLTWIKMIQTLNKPLSNVKVSQVTHYFLINSFCLTHLQSTLKSIVDFTVEFFDKSSWRRGWFIQYVNGSEAFRRIQYIIALQNNAVKACGCTLTPYVTDTAIQIADEFHGTARVITETL